MKVKKVSYQSPLAPEEFVQSLRETGFAVITDHPIQFSLVEATYAEWGRYFESDAKHQDTFKKETQFGYFPFRTENAKGSDKKDLKEFFHYFPWGTLPSSVQTYTLPLFRELTAMGDRLLGWLDEATPPETRMKFSMPLREMVLNSPDNLLRILHYPPLSGIEEEGAVRAAAHEDINLITLLVAGTQPGLQVQDLKGEWHDVPCDPGTIAVNSGDMLRECSGCFYPSTTHRVINPSGDAAKKSRFSMPLFLHPRREIRLSERHTAGSYLDERLKEIGLKT
jgi:isopenicillin N synthase-like dioxygenase